MAETVPTDEAPRKARRQALWMAIGLTMWWLLLAYPMVITVGLGQWVSTVLMSWAAAGWTYLVLRKRIRAIASGPQTDLEAG